MHRILIFRFISSHHNKLFHFLWPVLWKPGKSPWYWGRQRQKGGDLATVCGVSAENQPRTRCESHSRYISQNVGRVVFNSIQVLFNYFLAERTLELFFNLIQLFFNSFVPELKLKVFFRSNLILFLQDAHWKSYTQQCSPCLVNFTFIVHIEKATID